MPLSDWQFWLVTLLFLLALAWLLRGVLPIPILSRRYRRKKLQRRVNLTVGGKTVK
jgi:hypothetical protein